MLLKFKLIGILSILLLLTLCNSSSHVALDTLMVDDFPDLKIIEAFPALSFTRPVDFQVGSKNDNNVFVVTQRGIIWVFENDIETTVKHSFLDIQERIDDRSNEEGLLSVAFHPNYESNGYFYVNYTTKNSTTVISRFQVSPTNPSLANSNSEKILLEFEQPYGNHNGGQLAFGTEGYLYIGVGDGGSGNDPHGHGQNLNSILGTVLRIDVDPVASGKNYEIPNDNPFVNHPTYREEIYAYGLRNPWRMSFDAVTGTLWLGDVGQNKYEEVNIIENGGNYGWNIMEGFHCFKTSDCDTSDVTMPITEYNHDAGDLSITGGYVYRGNQIKELQGWYVYGDFASGRIWAIHTTDATEKLLFETEIHISSFGVDALNELYFCGFDDKIYKFSN